MVDWYNFDVNWEIANRTVARKLMVVDDYTNRQHEYDAYLNQNYLPFDTIDLASTLPADCKRLLGPRYLLCMPTPSHPPRLAAQKIDRVFCISRRQ